MWRWWKADHYHKSRTSFLASHNQRSLWGLERTQSFWVDEGTGKGKGGLSGEATGLGDKWRVRASAESSVSTAGSRSQREPHAVITIPGRGPSTQTLRTERVPSPHPHPPAVVCDTIQGKREERAHPEELFISRDRFILKRLFMPFYTIPNWTQNKLFNCRGDCLNQKKLEYCSLANMNFSRYPEGWDKPIKTYDQFWRGKKSYIFLVPLSHSEGILWYLSI